MEGTMSDLLSDDAVVFKALTLLADRRNAERARREVEYALQTGELTASDIEAQAAAVEAGRLRRREATDLGDGKTP